MGLIHVKEDVHSIVNNAIASSLRDYQKDCFTDTLERLETGANTVLVLPTGAGKTYVASAIIYMLERQGKRVLFTAHRTELIEQALNHFAIYGVTADAITSQSRIDVEKYDIIIVDEAHHCTVKNTYARFFKRQVLGLTATPWRLDGKGLGDLFTELVVGTTMPDLIANGYLVEPKFFGPPKGVADEIAKGLKIRMGDYVMSQALGERVIQISGDVVRTYRNKATGRKAIAYCVNVEHAKALALEFRHEGYKAESLTGEDTQDHRDSVISRFKSGLIDVVTNCMIFTEGFDAPNADACILVRPTASSSLYLQMVGRVMRPSPGKVDAIVLDHVGNTERHGVPSDYIEFSLEMTKPPKGAPCKTCPECGAYCPLAAKKCSECNYKFSEGDGEADIKFAEINCELVEVVKIPSKRCTHCNSLRTKVTRQEALLASLYCLSCKKFSVFTAEKEKIDSVDRAKFLADEVMKNARNCGKYPSIPAFKYRDVFGEMPSKHYREKAKEILEAENDYEDVLEEPFRKMNFFVNKEIERA
jgi:superfamily II DNA or RNA helicase